MAKENDVSMDEESVAAYFAQLRYEGGMWHCNHPQQMKSKRRHSK